MLLLFTYDDYYPSGGATDLTAIVNNVEEVVAYIIKNAKELAHSYCIDGWSIDNVHIFDTETGEITELKVKILRDKEFSVIGSEVTVGTPEKSRHFKPLGQR